ncbi:hypothetical protein QE152_g22374 [Popillia japonica]|uniref:Uncharacterized protein n=1 Tax=Popillia japonica TaxID=7064 RepID=A0AAW1KIY9_POPJA
MALCAFTPLKTLQNFSNLIFIFYIEIEVENSGNEVIGEKDNARKLYLDQIHNIKMANDLVTVAGRAAAHIVVCFSSNR